MSSATLEPSALTSSTSFPTPDYFYQPAKLEQSRLPEGDSAHVPCPQPRLRQGARVASQDRVALVFVVLGKIGPPTDWLDEYTSDAEGVRQFCEAKNLTHHARKVVNLAKATFPTPNMVSVAVEQDPESD